MDPTSLLSRAKEGRKAGQNDVLCNVMKSIRIDTPTHHPLSVARLCDQGGGGGLIFLILIHYSFGTSLSLYNGLYQNGVYSHPPGVVA